MNSSNTTNDGNNAPRRIGEVFYISGFLLATFAFTTNVPISVLLTTKKKLREQTHTFLVMSLSVADLIVSTGGLTQIIMDRFFHEPVHLCGIWSLLFSQGLFMRVYFTFVLSLNCYVAATSTTWSDKLFGGKRKYAILFVPSAVEVIINIGFFLFVKCEDHISSCTLYKMFCSFQATNNMIMAMLNIPTLLATFLMYALAMRAINARFGKGGQSQVSTIETTPQTVTDTRRKRHMTALKTLGLISASIMILTAPYLTFHLFVSTNDEVKPIFRVSLSFGVFLNSAIDPVIYTWRLKDIRKEISNMCCQCCRV